MINYDEELKSLNLIIEKWIKALPSKTNNIYLKTIFKEESFTDELLLPTLSIWKNNSFEITVKNIANLRNTIFLNMIEYIKKNDVLIKNKSKIDIIYFIKNELLTNEILGSWIDCEKEIITNIVKMNFNIGKVDNVDDLILYPNDMLNHIFIDDNSQHLTNTPFFNKLNNSPDFLNLMMIITKEEDYINLKKNGWDVYDLEKDLYLKINPELIELFANNKLSFRDDKKICFFTKLQENNKFAVYVKNTSMMVFLMDAIRDFLVQLIHQGTVYLDTMNVEYDIPIKRTILFDNIESYIGLENFINNMQLKSINVSAIYKTTSLNYNIINKNKIDSLINNSGTVLSYNKKEKNFIVSGRITNEVNKRNLIKDQYLNYKLCNVNDLKIPMNLSYSLTVKSFYAYLLIDLLKETDNEDLNNQYIDLLDMLLSDINSEYKISKSKSVFNKILDQLSLLPSNEKEIYTLLNTIINQLIDIEKSIDLKILKKTKSNSPNKIKKLYLYM